MFQDHVLVSLPLDGKHIDQILLMRETKKDNFVSFDFFHVPEYNNFCKEYTIGKILAIEINFERFVRNRYPKSLETIFSSSALSQIARCGIAPGTKKFYQYLFTKTILDENLEALKFHLLQELWHTKRDRKYNALPIGLQAVVVGQTSKPIVVIQNQIPCITELSNISITGQCLIAVEKPTSIHYEKLTKFVYSLCYTVAFCQVTGKLLYHPVFNSYQQKARLRHLNKTDPEILEFQEMAKTINETFYGKVDEAFTTKDTTAIKALNMLLEHQEENLPWYQSVDRFLAKKQTLPVGKDFFQEHQKFFDKNLGEVVIVLKNDLISKKCSYFTAKVQLFELEKVSRPMLLVNL